MADGWHKVARKSALAEGEVLGASVGDKQVAVYLVGGEIYATDNICTHAYACLSDGYLEDGIIECPLHAGRFDLRNGAGQGAPIEADLPVYPVRIEGDDVLVQLPCG